MFRNLIKKTWLVMVLFAFMVFSLPVITMAGNVVLEKHIDPNTLEERFKAEMEVLKLIITPEHQEPTPDGMGVFFYDTIIEGMHEYYITIIVRPGIGIWSVATSHQIRNRDEAYCIVYWDTFGIDEEALYTESKLEWAHWIDAWTVNYEEPGSSILRQDNGLDMTTEPIELWGEVFNKFREKYGLEVIIMHEEPQEDMGNSGI